jgi:hypothetical protein
MLVAYRTACRQISVSVGNYLGHATIHNEIGAIHEAAFVTGKEQDRLGLFDRFAKSACWEMDLSSMSLSRVIAKPVLK